MKSLLQISFMAKIGTRERLTALLTSKFCEMQSRFVTSKNLTGMHKFAISNAGEGRIRAHAYPIDYKALPPPTV